MKAVNPYKREITHRFGLRVRTGPSLDSPVITKLPKGTIVWVWQEDLSKEDQKDGYLWAKIGASRDENPKLKTKDKVIVGYIALYEIVPFTRRI